MSNTIIVTGATGSMGAAAVRQLTDKGCNVIMACRNMEKAENVRKEIYARNSSAGIYTLHLDISRPDSVRGFAADASSLLKNNGLRLTGIFNNAGIIHREYGLTPDGIERTLATNYVGPYLLTRLMLPEMTDKAHIVNMVSLTHKYVSIDTDLFRKPAGSFRQLGTYAGTKLALLLFSIALYRRLRDDTRQIRINVSDPGVVNSNMISMGRWFDPLANVFFRPFCKSPEKGVMSAMNAMQTDLSLMYFKRNGYSPISGKYLEHPLVDWLWQETAVLCSLPE